MADTWQVGNTTHQSLPSTSKKAMTSIEGKLDGGMQALVRVHTAEDVLSSARAWTHSVRVDGSGCSASASGLFVDADRTYIVTAGAFLRALAPGWAVGSGVNAQVQIEVFEGAALGWRRAELLGYLDLSPGPAAALLANLLSSQGWDRRQSASILDLAVVTIRQDRFCASPVALASWLLTPGTGAVVGEDVFVLGSPYGVFGPEIFFNTVTRGIICAVMPAPGVDALVIIDAPCHPGTCGAPVVTEMGRTLVGVVLPKLSRLDNLVVDLNFVLTTKELLLSVQRFLSCHNSALPPPRLSLTTQAKLTCTTLPFSYDQALLRKACEATVLISCGLSWGSGVLIDTQLGLVLTNAHVVRDHTDAIRGRCGCPAQWFGLEPLFVSAAAVPDVALLRVKAQDRHNLASLTACVPLPADSGQVVQANNQQEVFVLGYPLFSPGAMGFPLVSSGTLNCRGPVNAPGLLVTSAPVHPGSSGGPILSSRNGHLLGIITSFSEVIYSRQPPHGDKKTGKCFGQGRRENSEWVGFVCVVNAGGEGQRGR